MFRGSGFWSKRTKTQKITLVLTTLATIIVVVVLCCVLIKTYPEEGDSFCSTKVCLAEVEKFKANLNDSVDPCDDFYEFACGNYPIRNQLPPDKSRLATFDVVADTVLDGLKEVFVRVASESMNDSTSSSSSSSKPIKFISQFFVMCNRSGSDLTPLTNLVSNLGGWTIADIPASDKDLQSWNETLLSIVADLGESVLISVMVSPNTSDTNTYALTVSYSGGFFCCR